MSEALDTTDRLRRHLAGSLSEAERQELERAVIEDDELFEQLEAAESDLIDQYARGELDEESARKIAALVESSPRLRAKEETTLALTTWRGGQRTGEKPSSSSPEGQSTKTNLSWRGWWIAAVGVALMLLALVAWLLVQSADLKTSFVALDVESQALEERIEAIEKTVSRLEASNRALARSLARFESEDR